MSMLTAEELKGLFKDKLEQTDSLDAAFLKAVWVAYNRGLEDGRAEAKEKQNDG